ncbi:hypothetical protein H8E88_31005 [candidate division KSB1 bacterium]|nr:hypothetical protein [candidate division KSB1 bacterium]MBL7094185.1 hypothetical protein [candidate division KSB1 bacterium]
MHNFKKILAIFTLTFTLIILFTLQVCQAQNLSGSLYVTKYVTNGGDGKILEFDLTTLNEVREINIGIQPVSIDYLEPGKLLIADHGSNSLIIVNEADFSILNEIQTSPSLPLYSSNQVRITPDREYAYVLNYQHNNVSIVSLNDYSIVKKVQTGSAPRGLYFDSMHNMAYICCHYGSPDVIKIDMTTLNVVGTIDYGGYKPTGCVVHELNNWLYIPAH